jgi:RHS repeat-associated protein
MSNTAPEPADGQMNQYTTSSFDSRLYDKNGDLNTINNGLPTQKGLTYDYRNQMVKVTDVNTGKVHTYSYDAMGRRIQKVIDSSGTPQTTRYFYAGRRVIEEQDGSGVTQATYVYGNYIDEVLNMQRGANKYYYHSDDLFSVMAITNADGNAVERYEYEDYGRPVDPTTLAPIVGSPSAIGNPYYFTGRNYDAETGLYYYRTRYLDPRAGRFTTRDTIGIWGDRSNQGNGYTYVGNRPTSAADPSGVGVYPVDYNGASYGEPSEIEWDFGDGEKNIYPTDFEGASYGEPSEIEWDFGDSDKEGVYPTDYEGASYGEPSEIEWDFGDSDKEGVYPTDYEGASRAVNCWGGHKGYKDGWRWPWESKKPRPKF